MRCQENILSRHSLLLQNYQWIFNTLILFRSANFINQTCLCDLVVVEKSTVSVSTACGLCTYAVVCAFDTKNNKYFGKKSNVNGGIYQLSRR